MISLFFFISFLENFCLRQCLLHTDTTGEYIFFSFSLDILFFLIFLLFRPLPSLFRSFKRCIYNNLLILLFFRFFHFCTWFEIHNSNLYVFLSVLSFTATPVGKPNTNTQYMPLSLCILMSDWFFFFEYFSHQRGRDDDGDDVWPFCRASTFQILLIFRLFFFPLSRSSVVALGGDSVEEHTTKNEKKSLAWQMKNKKKEEHNGIGHTHQRVSNTLAQ